MANPYVMSYTMQDSNGVVAASPFYYVPTTPATITVANAIVDWAAVGDLIDAASNAVILGGNISIPVAAQGGWKNAPVAVNDVSDVINFNFNNGSTRYVNAFLLLDFIAAALDGAKIDLAQADIAALVTALSTGGLTSGGASNEAAQLNTTLRDAFQADRKHRKQLRSKSLTIPT